LVARHARDVDYVKDTEPWNRLFDELQLLATAKFVFGLSRLNRALQADALPAAVEKALREEIANV